MPIYGPATLCVCVCRCVCVSGSPLTQKSLSVRPRTISKTDQSKLSKQQEAHGDAVPFFGTLQRVPISHRHVALGKTFLCWGKAKRELGKAPSAEALSRRWALHHRKHNTQRKTLRPGQGPFEALINGSETSNAKPTKIIT